jgi:hypothetical protein
MTRKLLGPALVVMFLGLSVGSVSADSGRHNDRQRSYRSSRHYSYAPSHRVYNYAPRYYGRTYYYDNSYYDSGYYNTDTYDDGYYTGGYVYRPYRRYHRPRFEIRLGH